MFGGTLLYHRRRQRGVLTAPPCGRACVCAVQCAAEQGHKPGREERQSSDPRPRAWGVVGGHLEGLRSAVARTGSVCAESSLAWQWVVKLNREY